MQNQPVQQLVTEASKRATDNHTSFSEHCELF